MPRWLFWTLLTLISWGLWAVLSKLVGGGLSEIHLQAISTLGLLPIVAALLFTKDSSTGGDLRRGIPLALGAGLFSSVGNIAFYEALSHGKAATIVPLTALSPVVTILLSFLLLHERFNRVQFVGICLSIVAVFLYYSAEPASAESSGPVARWLPMALVAIALWGITAFMQKMSTNHLSAPSSALWFLAAFFPVAGAILFYDSLPGDISSRTWGIGAALGFTLALGNLTILLAFASGGKASIISPLAGLYPVVSIPLAIALLNEKVNTQEVVAIALALAAVIMLSYQSAPDETPMKSSTTG
jgi:uncharacterized membrane protein